MPIKCINIYGLLLHISILCTYIYEKIDETMSENATALKRGYAGSYVISIAPANKV